MMELLAISKKFVCLILLLVLSSRSEQREILRYEKDGTARMEKGTPGSRVTGEWSWMDNKGEKKTIKYEADERGFRAFGDVIPVSQWTISNDPLKMPKIGSSVVPFISSIGRNHEQSKLKAEGPSILTQTHEQQNKQQPQQANEQQKLEQPVLQQQQSLQKLLQQQSQNHTQLQKLQVQQLKQLQTHQQHEQKQLQQQVQQPEKQLQKLHQEQQQHQQLQQVLQPQQPQEEHHHIQKKQQQQQQAASHGTKRESRLTAPSGTLPESEIKTNDIPITLGQKSKIPKENPKTIEAQGLNHLKQDQQLVNTPKIIPGTAFILLSHMRLPLKDSSIVPKVQQIKPIPVEVTGAVQSTITGILSAPRAINVLGNKMGKRLSSIPDPVVRKIPTPSKVEGMLNLDNFLRPAHITSNNRNQTPNPLQSNYDYYYYDYYYDHQPSATTIEGGVDKQPKKQLASNKQSRTHKDRSKQRRIRSEESMESFEDFEDISEEEVEIKKDV